jgi:2,5-diamino-6-(ribosylamino)-4(3H)-pyrimidinone 5'-phosphate reductase
MVMTMEHKPRRSMFPHVILHNAVSVDGRIDRFTPDVGLFYELAARWHEDATLAGSDTILAMEDQISEPGPGSVDHSETEARGERPLLVIPDSRGRIRRWQALRHQPYWREVIALCSHATPAAFLNTLRTAGVRFLVAGDDHVDLRAALGHLAEHFGVRTVRVDSGGTLNGVLLRAGLVHEVSLLVHPALVGGVSPRSMFRAPDLGEEGAVIDLTLSTVEQVQGGIVWLRYAISDTDRHEGGEP